MRLSQAARKFNVGIVTISDLLASKGYKIDSKPNTKITNEQYSLLEKEFESSMAEKKEAAELTIGIPHADVVIKSDKKQVEEEDQDEDDIFIFDKSTKEAGKAETPAKEKPKEVKTSTETEEVTEPKKTQEQAQVAPVAESKEKTPTENIEETTEKESTETEQQKGETDKETTEEKEFVTSQTDKLPGLKILDKIDLDSKGKIAPPKTDQDKPEEKKVDKPISEEKQTAPVSEEKQVAKEEGEISTPSSPVTQKTEEPTDQSKQKTDIKDTVIEPSSSIEKEVQEKEKPNEETTKPIEKASTPETPKEKEQAPEVVKQEEKEESTEGKKGQYELTKAKDKVPVQKSEPKKVEEEGIEESVENIESVDSPEEVVEGNSIIEAKADRLQGLRVLGKIDLPASGQKKKPKPIASSDDRKDKKKRKRKRVRIRAEEGEAQTAQNKKAKTTTTKVESGKETKPVAKETKVVKKAGGFRKERLKKEEPTQQEVQEQYKKTLAKINIGAGSKSNKSKYKREKRDAAAVKEANRQAEENHNLLKVAEFISTNELSTLMEVTVNEIIAKCMGMGMFVSINQRLDAEAITIIADEFGFDVEFTSAEEEIEVAVDEDKDNIEDLVERAPIVTIMGHVDHGKTSLLDYIRESKVASEEAGGITQHIGAYSVETKSGRKIVFLDTPGHEAFTAMRARGAKVTDVVIIVIAADDNVMPQTIEAINHAQVAGVPIVIAINKVDKPGANPNKIKEELANINILVEEWGGKVQSKEISAKTGDGIEDLLEMVLLESDILELKANPKKKAIGTVIEASLDKGRGYVSTILIQSGTVKIGDVTLAGHHYGKVKAMTDSWGKPIKEAGPSTPVQILGLNGAPQAGDKVNVMDSDREAREIASKREQILREQSIRATKRTTLSDIGRRIALGNFQQLNVILRGDVDGSVEALSDSLQKLSTEEIEVNIIHKAVGPISENDVLLATASDAIVIGFQVRPTPSARKLAEKESVEVRLYSVIYHAIEEVKAAMEGLLSPDIQEVIVGNVEVRETYKISKVGTIAGCFVTEGYIKRNSKIRLVRDGIVVYGGESGGEIQALKRFKDDVNEVRQGFECGLNIKNFNDIKVGDNIEVFEEKEVKRTLS